jgi:hypothetical protein
MVVTQLQSDILRCLAKNRAETELASIQFDAFPYLAGNLSQP